MNEKQHPQRAKRKGEIRRQRVAMMKYAEKAADAPAILTPNNEPVQDPEIQSAMYFGMVLALTWVLGEEYLPSTKWTLPGHREPHQMKRLMGGVK